MISSVLPVPTSPVSRIKPLRNEACLPSLRLHDGAAYQPTQFRVGDEEIEFVRMPLTIETNFFLKIQGLIYQGSTIEESHPLRSSKGNQGARRRSVVTMAILSRPVIQVGKPPGYRDLSYRELRYTGLDTLTSAYGHF